MTAGHWTKARVIWNPNAGQKGGIPVNRASPEAIRTLLVEHGFGGAIQETESAEQARTLARDAVRDGCDLVVAAGGDGTIGIVATELLGSRVALGVVPLGSIMNIPRMLGIPRDPAAALDAIADGEVRAIDVGRTRDRPFFENGSIGLNAAIFREVQGVDEGDWLSLPRSVWVAFRYRPARMLIRLDDDIVRTRALMVTVSNGPYTGAALTVAPAARVDDGLFDVRVFRHFSKLTLLRHLASIAFGRRRYEPHVSTYRSRRVRIESVHPLPCRVDSHDQGTTPIDFEVVPRALRVVVPRAERREPGAALKDSAAA
ncbi:MAG TPA: diacylglycerol kinase family protein [Candidatus Limnocylindrales bacterium]